MSEKNCQVGLLMEKWGVPFARAFGEFVRVVAQDSNFTNESPAKNVSDKVTIETPGLSVVEMTAESNPVGFARIQKIIAADAGKSVEFVEFDEQGNPPAITAGNHLKKAFKAHGVKQAVVARRMGVAPSVVSRVIKHPENSRLQTIRRIAEAAGIPLSELVQ